MCGEILLHQVLVEVLFDACPSYWSAVIKLMLACACKIELFTSRKLIVTICGSSKARAVFLHAKRFEFSRLWRYDTGYDLLTFYSRDIDCPELQCRHNSIASFAPECCLGLSGVPHACNVEASSIFSHTEQDDAAFGHVSEGRQCFVQGFRQSLGRIFSLDAVIIRATFTK